MAEKTIGQLTDEQMQSLLDVYHGRRQAELNLERARAKEAAVGRQAIPKWLSEVQAMRERQQKQQQQATSRSQQGGLTPQQMVPLEVQVTGQPRPKGDLGAVMNLAEGIGNRMQPGGPQPAQQAGGQIPPQPAGGAQPLLGTGMQAATGVAQQALEGARNSAAAQQAQSPTGPTPGSAVPVYQQLSGPERWLRGAMGLGAIATKNLPYGIQSLGEAALGQTQVGIDRVPTLEDVAVREAPVIAAIQSQIEEGLTPEDRAKAKVTMDRWIGNMRQRLPDEVIEMSVRFALEARLMDEAKQLQELQTYEAKQEAAMSPLDRVRRKAMDAGTLDALNPAERQILNLSQRGTNVTVNMQPATKNKIESDLNLGLGIMQQLNRVRDAFYPEFFERGSSLMQEWRIQQDKLGLLDDAGKRDMNAYIDLEQGMNYLKQQQVRSIAGATMSLGEIKLTLEPLIRGGVSPTEANRLLNNFIDDLGLSLYRNDQARLLGFDDPKTAFTLADAKQMAREGFNRRALELHASGLTKDQALFQADAEFRGRYGIDGYKLMGMERP